MHFAAAKADLRIFEILTQELRGDVFSKTSHGLNFLHCAAQDDKGVLSLIWAEKYKDLNVNERDNYECTPLHFAVLNK
jgi:hypothetical protein